MSALEQSTVADQIQQCTENVERWKAWAGQLAARGPSHPGVRPGDLAGTVSAMANIVTGKAPPSPPSGYDAHDPNALLKQLQLQLTFCRQQAQQLSAAVGPDASQHLLDPVADLVGAPDAAASRPV